MTSQLNKIYWDSSPFICFLRKHEGDRRKICEDILYHARDGRVTLYTSTFTVAEVVRPSSLNVAGARPFSREEIGEIQAMFQWPWIKKVDLDQRVARKAVELQRDYALFAVDSVHAASALIAEADVLQHWERNDEYGKIGRLIRVEHPRMLTYGASHEARGARLVQDALFRTATANSENQSLRLRFRP
jgi:predicted nucleic acid-binding protein